MSLRVLAQAELLTSWEEAAPELERQPRIAEILGNALPVISIHAVPGARVTLVGSNHVETGLLATRHLLGHGHRRIGMIAGPRSRRVVHSRLRGYEQALREAGLTPDPALVEDGDWQVEGGYEATCRLLARIPDLTALFVQNDIMAIGALRRNISIRTSLATAIPRSKPPARRVCFPR